MTKYLQNFEFTFQNGSNFGKTLANFLLLSAEKFKNFSFFFIDLLTNYVGVIVPGFSLSSIVLEWNKIIHQKLRQKILVCKISGLQNWLKYQEEQLTPLFCSPQICCVSVVNKKAIFQGFMTKYLQSFEFKSQKRANFGQIFAHFLLTSAEKIIYFTFILYGVIDQLCRSSRAKFQVIWLCRTSFMAICWKYLKIQLNSWYADSLICKIDILKKIQNC